MLLEKQATQIRIANSSIIVEITRFCIVSLAM